MALPILSNAALAARRALSFGSVAIGVDYDKCVSCASCVDICEEQGFLDTEEDDFEAPYETGDAVPPARDLCVGCGQCTTVCPTAALTEKNETARFDEILAQKGDKVLVAMTAPAFRVGIAEESGMGEGVDGSAKFISAMRGLGFDYVFDVTTAADITIMEEVTELLSKLGKQTMFTSCCPAWVQYVEGQRPELIPYLSTCKSPQQMASAVVKQIFSGVIGRAPEDIVLVSCMPCTAKKGEIVRSEDMTDTDLVMTVREMGQVFREHSVDLATQEDGHFDQFLGDCSGAGDIFGTTGGVMEAALRTAYKTVTGEEVPDEAVAPLRDGTESGIKEVSIDVPGADKPLKIAVVHGGEAMHDFLEDGESFKEYDFVEIMTCPGGCSNGGGMPMKKGKTAQVVENRQAGLRTLDSARSAHRSDENPVIQAIYEKYLGKPNGEKAHELLHTHYHKQE